jgi:hypothetical protein
LKSDVVFSRDVVHHQTDPVGFLSDLYAISNRYLALRIRTREVGTTVFEVEQSCQYTYGRWVPYIVYNTTEFVDLIRSFQPAPAKITLWRHPTILGGQNSRFVPKELYYPETATAETGVLIEKGSGTTGGDAPLISIETRSETHQPPHWTRLLRRVARRLNL